MDAIPSSPASRWDTPALLDAVALVCILFGNTLSAYVCPPSWAVVGMFPPFWVGVVVAAIRVARWPTRRPFESVRSGAARLPSGLVWFLILSRVAVLAVGLIASFAHPERLAGAPSVSPNRVVGLPARWDALWYHDIARYGYEWHPERGDAQQNIAFFPAYPFAMRVAGDVVTIPAWLVGAPGLLGNGDARVVWGGLFASVLFFVIAAVRLHQLAAEEIGNSAAADRACILLATYPFALFFSVPYSESFALLALVSVVLAWRRREATKGLFWGLFLGLCRSNGWCVAAALLADRLVGGARPFPWRRAAVVIAAAPLGAALYSAYVYHLTGDPFAWASAQHAWGGDFQPASFIVRRWGVVQKHGFDRWFRRDPTDALSFAAAAGMIAAALRMLIRRQWLYGSMILAYLAPAVAIDLPATGRMTALLFPVFVAIGARVSGLRFAALATVFAASEIWLAYRFFLWRTPY